MGSGDCNLNRMGSEGDVVAWETNEYNSLTTKGMYIKPQRWHAFCDD